MANDKYCVRVMLDLAVIDDLEPYLTKAVEQELLSEDEALKLLAKELVDTMKIV